MSIGTSNEYSKTCLKQLLSKRPKIGFQDQISLRVNAGQKYCRMLPSLKSLFCLFLSGHFTQVLMCNITWLLLRNKIKSKLDTTKNKQYLRQHENLNWALITYANSAGSGKPFKSLVACTLNKWK